MVCGYFILPEPASYVFFYAIFNLRNLFYLIGALLDASFLFYIQFVYSEEIPHKSWKKLLTRNRGLKQKSHRKVGRSRSVEIGLKLKNPTQNFEYPIAGWYWQNGKWCYNICEWFAYWRAADVNLQHKTAKSPACFFGGASRRAADCTPDGGRAGRETNQP